MSEQTAVGRPPEVPGPTGEPEGDVARARRSGPGTVAVAVVLVGAGLLFTTTAQTAKGTPLRSQSADLAALIESESAQQQARLARLTQLQAQYEQESEQGSAGSATVRALRRQVASLEPQAGLSAVRGAGLVVTLNDAPHNGTLPPGATPDDLVVHQQDVQAVVNALWQGGATAMMLQDQRVISTSAVRCVGNTLILQGRVYSPPYTITAIGDETALRAALAASPDVQYYLQYVAAMDLGWNVTPYKRLNLPAYSGPLALTHAKETS